jgi:4-amino-4-deoxy-L-arabinose transferase-like glycosyltransferase
MQAMSRPLARALIVLVALAHATFFIIYQSPDWLTEWTDQNGYTRLGQALAQTGQFTRYPFYPKFIPEVLRTPGYPLFVAAVNRTIGEGHLPVAIAQAFVFAALCLIVYETARRVAGDRTALAAGLVTALYPTFPYFGALTLTELFTTFVVTLGVYLWLRALDDGGRWAIAAGGVLGWAALTRPTFQYMSIALAGAAWIIAPRTAAARRRTIVVLATVAVVIAPWLLYNYVHFQTLTFTPAGGIGRGLFEGVWQVAMPGRVQTRLTDLAATTWNRDELDAKVTAVASQSGLDAGLLLRYVHQWQDVRRMWDTPQDPMERAIARVAADHEYGRLGLEEIGRDPIAHAWRRATRGVLLLWITEIPVRYSDINALPVLAIRAMWLFQALIMAAAAAGVVVLWRHGYRTEAAAFAAVIVYVTAVHAVLYSEARYFLPARPVVLLLATTAFGHRFIWLSGHRD